MNDVISALDGFKNLKLSYLDTHSIYIHKNDYEVLKKKQNLIEKDLFPSKNYYAVKLILYTLSCEC